jgi:hypothetical protein
VSLEPASEVVDAHSSFAAQLRAQVEAELSTDLDADHRAYTCARCECGCINPRFHRLARAGVCLDCYVSYLTAYR